MVFEHLQGFSFASFKEIAFFEMFGHVRFQPAATMVLELALGGHHALDAAVLCDRNL